MMTPALQGIDDARMQSDPHPHQHHTTDDDELGVVGVVGLIILVSLLAWPRLMLIGFAIFDTDLFNRAYDSWVIPVAGFFLLPWTTLAYASMWTISSDRVTGAEWVVVGIGLLLDVWAWSAFRRR